VVHGQDMIDFALKCSKEVGYDMLHAPYAYFPLPQFETPAEIQLMKECGMATVGASTIPEQMTFYILGLKGIAFAAVTNPGTGLEDDFTHDGEANLIAAQRCLEGLTATILKIIEKVELPPPKKLENILIDTNSLNLQRVLYFPLLI